MHALLAQSDQMLAAAIDVAPCGDEAFHAALEALPAPIYVTDENGVITYYNKACVGFAGRRPAVGKDRWCVTWKLYTEAGEFLPHDQCPMARAIETKQALRGLTAVAERPDGTRVTFTPFPTPLYRDGVFIGAVNMLVDVTEIRQIDELRAEASRARRLAGNMGDRQTIDALSDFAEECQAKADALEASAH